MSSHVCHGCQGGLPLGVAGGPCKGRCMVWREVCDDNPFGRRRVLKRRETWGCRSSWWSDE